MRIRIPTLTVALLISILIPAAGQAQGPGGWGRVGTAPGGTAPSIDGAVQALNADRPGELIVGGNFDTAGGITGAAKIASWNGTNWSMLGPANSLNGSVRAIAFANGKLYAGGTFTNAGGPNGDYLAVLDSGAWRPACNGGEPGPTFNSAVDALQVVGSKLYVGGSFLDAAGISTGADGLIRCDIATDVPEVGWGGIGVGGAVSALTVDANGTVYAGGNFSDAGGDTSGDYVARLIGFNWRGLASFGTPGPVQDKVRSLDAIGNDVYVGTDAANVAGIAAADHVARWNANSETWSSLGGPFLPTPSSIYAIKASGLRTYVGGDFQNASGNPLADGIIDFDGTDWLTMGSNGSGDGPWSSGTLALEVFNGQLYAGGTFTNAGGDLLADQIARYVAPGLPDPNFDIEALRKRTCRYRLCTYRVSVADPGRLVVAGKGSSSVFGGTPRAAHSTAYEFTAAGSVELKLRPDRSAKRKLRKKGKAKSKIELTWTPTGGEANVKTLTAKFTAKKRK